MWFDFGQAKDFFLNLWLCQFVTLQPLDAQRPRVPLWKDLKNLDQWYEKIKTRPAYKKAIYDWGDVTADQRAQNGKDAYPKIKEYWDKA